MIEYVGTILSVLSGLGALVGLYIVIKLDINTMKAEIANNKTNIEKIHAEKKELHTEMKELKEMMQQMLLKLTKLETLQEYEQGKKDGKTK